jgi:hypothetical protein
MLKNLYSLVLVLVITCLSAARASADFMELPAPANPPIDSARAATSASEHVLAVSELRSDSGYLELGYYALDGHTPSLKLARPNDAGVSEAGVWDLGLGNLGQLSGPVALGALLLALLAVAGFVARRPRQHV